MIANSDPTKSKKYKLISIDKDERFIYYPFEKETGPPSLSQIHMFVQFIDEMTEQSDSPLLLFTIDSNQISNHILYLTAYRMIHMKMTPQKAYSPFSKLAHQIQPYYDSSSKTHPFPVPIIECAKGVWKAIELNWYSYSSFDVEETRRLERVDEGDMNWLIPGKLLGFASPFPVNNVLGGFKVATPDALVPIFKSFGITSIVRLCKRTYDENIFKSNGFQHYEMFFPDCGVPSVSIRNRFLNIVQKHNEVIGLHCKAGLGRTYVFVLINNTNECFY